MNFKTNIALLTILLFLSFSSIAQQKRKINIELAPFGEKVDDKNVLTRDNSEQVRISHNGIIMWCDEAIYYPEQDFLEAYGNVRINQGDTINMTSKYVEYSGKTELAFARGDVVLTDPTSTISTDRLYFDRLKQEAFYRESGKVVRDSSGTITSQIGRYYLDIKKYQFVDNVVLVDPEYTINSDQLDFYSETGLAYLFGPSTIVTEDSKTYCERCFFNTEKKIGHAVKNSRIDYDNRTVEGDSLFFDNNRNFASATNNITITDTINNSIIKGHYGEVYKDIDYAFVTKKALAITVQEGDSTYIHSDTIAVRGKAENRITKAYYNAKIYKSDMSGKADSIHINHKEGITKLINIARFSSSDAFAKNRFPVLWNVGNQMTGDTIKLIANKETETLDTLKVYNNAYLISKDSLGDGYNQIIGKELFGLFEDNKIYQVDVIKNAETIFWARNDDDELIGLDRSRSGKMKILIEDNDILQIDKIGLPTGKTYPEDQIPEREKLFRDFIWRDEERPKNIEDLFKDDLPIELPIIKGLDEYIPQKEFFDAELLERINNAAPKESVNLDKDKVPKENKAARNIPKEVLKTSEKPLIKAQKPTLKIKESAIKANQTLKKKNN